ncbi:hypothetical protein ACFQS7_26920 [Dankookia sp. GCM10030260]|uniref:hypothetical protein n=1 Tax=Dankookia sp. GCM10030260 TaxID=3273390 RepID=UPI003605F051
MGIDNSFVDTLRQADSALSFMGRGELRRGRLGLFLDGIYTRLAYDDVRAGPLTLDATSVLGVLEFGAAYEVADGPWRMGGRDDWALDVLAGGRWTHLKTEVSLARFPSGVSTTDWVDPFGGLRLRGQLGERWEVSLRGDVGGGTGGSRFAWQAGAFVGYRFEMFGLQSAAVLGYRALSQDFRSAKLVWDTTLYGPVLGLSIRF